METKQIIQEKLEFHKRQSMTYEMLNRCANHLYDAFRQMEMAMQYCDDPEIREKLEGIKKLLGRDKEIASYHDNDHKTVISQVQELLEDAKS